MFGHDPVRARAADADGVGSRAPPDEPRGGGAAVGRPAVAR
jgi:hypothetical protein